MEGSGTGAIPSDPGGRAREPAFQPRSREGSLKRLPGLDADTGQGIDEVADQALCHGVIGRKACLKRDGILHEENMITACKCRRSCRSESRPVVEARCNRALSGDGWNDTGDCATRDVARWILPTMALCRSATRSIDFLHAMSTIISFQRHYRSSADLKAALSDTAPNSFISY